MTCFAVEEFGVPPRLAKKKLARINLARGRRWLHKVRTTTCDIYHAASFVRRRGANRTAMFFRYFGKETDGNVISFHLERIMNYLKCILNYLERVEVETWDILTSDHLLRVEVPTEPPFSCDIFPRKLMEMQLVSTPVNVNWTIRSLNYSIVWTIWKNVSGNLWYSSRGIVC